MLSINSLYYSAEDKEDEVLDDALNAEKVDAQTAAEVIYLFNSLFHSILISKINFF